MCCPLAYWCGTIRTLGHCVKRLGTYLLPVWHLPVSICRRAQGLLRHESIYSGDVPRKIRSRVPAKKLVVSINLQYILIAVGTLLLFTFVRQPGGVLLTFLLAGVLAYATATTLYGIAGVVFAVPIVPIISATRRYLRETLLFEHWGKAPVTGISVGAEEPVAVPGEVRRAVSAGEVRGDYPEAGGRR